jgi:branched-chain amino acid transport system permease protein
MIKLPFPDEQLQRLQRPARIAGIVGTLGMAASVLIPWSYTSTSLDDMSYPLAPSPLQFHFLALSLLGLLAFAVPLLGRARLGKLARAAGWNSAAKTAAGGGVAVALVAIVAIALESGGLVNTEPGVWVALGFAVRSSSAWRACCSPARTCCRCRRPGSSSSSSRSWWPWC